MSDTITDELVKEHAKGADVHVRTMIRRLAGLPVRGRVGARIDRYFALRAAQRPTPQTTQPPRQGG